MKYRATFHGRTKGAIGVTYRIHETVDGETREAAERALYERFEHLSDVRLTPLPDESSGPDGDP